MFIPGKQTEFVVIKPKRVPVDSAKPDGGEMLYWFVIYDLCQVTENSTVQLKIENKIGTFTGNIEGRLDPVQTFKVICVERNSDWFVP